MYFFKDFMQDFPVYNLLKDHAGFLGFNMLMDLALGYTFLMEN